MSQGMEALINVNSQLQDLQNQAISGKKINSASDGLAAYLSSQNYTNRATRLGSINDTLTSNLATIKAAQTGLSSIRSTISSTLDTLKAASQTQAFVAATNQTDTTSTSASNTQIGMTITMFDGNGVQSNNAVTNATALTNPMNAANGGSQIRINGQALAQGQIFSINGKFLRISGAAATDTVPAGNAADGSSATSPVYVRTVGDLLAAVRGDINGADNTTGVANLNNFRIIANGSGTISFGQSAGTAVAIQTMFASGRAHNNNPTANYTADEQGQVSNSGSYQSFQMTATDHTITGGTNGQTADARRTAAAKSYTLAMNQINQYLQAASVSGTNLLNGDNLKVTFDEKGNSSNFQIQNASGTAMTFSASGLGLVSATTGTSVDTAANFQTNDDTTIDPLTGSPTGLNAAITKLTNALSSLDLGDAQTAQFQATTQNRSDFNTSIIQLLNDSSNSLTAADMSEVSAKTAALQVQQGFAQTILANTKQSDQSVMQLLR
jgi:hypothetical protein